jgi:hypothetical protein
VDRDRERGILIVVRDPGTGFPGRFPVAPEGKMSIPITAVEAIKDVPCFVLLESKNAIKSLMPLR